MGNDLCQHCCGLQGLLYQGLPSRELSSRVAAVRQQLVHASVVPDARMHTLFLEAALLAGDVQVWMHDIAWPAATPIALLCKSARQTFQVVCGGHWRVAERHGSFWQAGALRHPLRALGVPANRGFRGLSVEAQVRRMLITASKLLWMLDAKGPA